MVLSVFAFGGCQSASNLANVSSGVQGGGVVPQVVQTGGGDSWVRFLLNSGDEPYHIVAGPDGNMWFTSPNTNTILRITMEGVVTHFPLTGGPGFPADITVGPDHALWFTEQSGIGRITTDGTATHYPIQQFDVGTRSITRGPNGNVWFTVNGGSTVGYVGKITTSGVITLYQVGVSAGSMEGIVAGPDGNIWFAVSVGSGKVAGAVGRITPAGTITLFAPDPAGPRPQQIVQAGDHHLYYLDAGNRADRRAVVRVDATTGATTLIGRVMRPGNLVPVGSDSLWYMSACGCPGMYVRGISLTNGSSSTKLTSPYSDVGDVALGPDGNFWIAWGGTKEAGIDVAIRRSMHVSPSSLTMFSNENATVTVTEKRYAGVFKATSGDNTIVKINSINPARSFDVQAQAAGTTTITLDDQHGNTATIPVTVSNR
jgi:virginiamycin B lyase